MRHRRRGRVLGRSPSHRKALFANMTSALFLTERETSDLDIGVPKVKGRIITTLEKAKEIRPMIEKCITIARKGLTFEKAAEPFGTSAARNTDAYKAWRKSEDWKKWVEARGPAVHARRRVLSMIRDKTAVSILFDTIAPRFEDRDGGYTRIMRLAKPRLGDNGTRAIIEFVGKNDRVKKKATKPSFAESSESAE
ncbi:MAG: L17 family ribosomal protein [Pirellulaceae bacterium]|nr:L17 family ribosomal protein [Pirellulaceae bacterium]